MQKLSSWFILLFITAGAVFAAPAVAEQSKRLGPWEVHYNAFNSTLLRPEMARQYGLERSNTVATLNIAVLAAELPGNQRSK